MILQQHVCMFPRHLGKKGKLSQHHEMVLDLLRYHQKTSSTLDI